MVNIEVIRVLCQTIRRKHSRTGGLKLAEAQPRNAIMSAGYVRMPVAVTGDKAQHSFRSMKWRGDISRALLLSQDADVNGSLPMPSLFGLVIAKLKPLVSAYSVSAVR